MWPAMTNRHNLFGVVEIDAFDLDGYSQHGRCKRDSEVLLKRRVKSDALFGFVVRVDNGFFDQLVQVTRAQTLLRCAGG
jgi:hypothetical protein